MQLQSPINNSTLQAAVVKAKNTIKKGDRVRCKKCPGTKRVFTFSHWDGNWMVSNSGINDYHPSNVDRVNGADVDFNNNK